MADLPSLQAIETRADRLFLDAGIDVVSLGAPPLAPLDGALRTGALIVCDGPDGPAGFAAARPVDAAFHIVTLAVDPAHQRRGVGRALVRACVDAGRWAFHPAITLTTFRDVPWNAPFYATLGFIAAEDDLLGPELAAIRASERRNGLDALGPRLAMAKLL